MLNFTHLIILSVIQGITEFLPISSSAHTTLLPHLMNWKDQGLLLDIAVHFGTLLAVMLYFRKDIAQMTVGGIDLLRGRKSPEKKLFLQLSVATIPVVITGAVLGAYVEGGARTIEVIAWSSIGFGLLLYVADRYASTSKTIDQMSYKHAFLAGIGQSFAVIPGTSRAGASMTALRFLGFSRFDTAHYSCLMSIPTIMAASVWMGIKVLKVNHFELYYDIVLAAIFSFIMGYISIMFMMKWVQRATYNVFVGYRILLGILLLSWVYWI